MTYLFAGYGLLALGMGLVPALITTFRADFGLSAAQAANIHNFKDSGLISATLIGPFLLARLGTWRTIQISIATALTGCVVFVLAHGVTGVESGAFLHGAAFSLGGIAMVTHLFTLTKRYRRIGAMLATFGVASFLAPALVAVSVDAHGHYGRIYLVFAACLTALVPFGSVAQKADSAAPVEPTSIRGGRRFVSTRLRACLPDIILFAVLTAGETAVVSWVTSLAQYRYGASLAGGSTLLAVLWAIHAPVRASGDFLRHRFSPRHILVLGSVTAATGALIICAGTMPRAYVGVALFTLGIAALIPIQQTVALDRVEPFEHGSLNACLGIAAAGFTTVIVWLTGIASDTDPRLPFVTATALLLLAAGLSLRIAPNPGTLRTVRVRSRAGSGSRGDVGPLPESG